MTKNRPVTVFIGPSLPCDGLPEGIDADIRPPAAQGDLTAAALRHPGGVIALVDGVFQGAPAVRHKEILFAISRGASVFGAASMGALRAAEMSDDGMHGRGFVFRWYRRFQLAPDDAVAVLHTPAELGAVAISHALIDFRLTLRKARRKGLIDGHAEAALVKAATGLHYSERNVPAILRLVPKEVALAAEPVLAKGGETQKQGDAALLLRELRDRQAQGQWPESTAPSFVPTDAFLQDVSEAGFSLDSFAGD